MKIYRWQETELHFILVLRPDELFDLSTVEQPNPDEKEARLRARNLVSGEFEGYAMAHLKAAFPERALRSMYERAPDVDARRDAEQLRTLRARISAKGLTA